MPRPASARPVFLHFRWTEAVVGSAAPAAEQKARGHDTQSKAARFGNETDAVPPGPFSAETPVSIDPYLINVFEWPGLGQPAGLQAAVRIRGEAAAGIVPG